MRKFLILVLICFFSNVCFAQKLNEPKLLGTWYGGEDFGEFIYHKVEQVKYSFLNDNPNGKIVARICSNEKKLPLALVNSTGFAFNLPRYTKHFQISDAQVFFARSSNCGGKSEEYWFVPQGRKIEYDEIVLAKRVKVQRWIEDFNENPDSQIVRNEFAENTKKFIEELKNNPNAEGFIILNLKTKNRSFQEALKALQRERIDKSRYQIVKRKAYSTTFPEFMTITINE